jgi:hypothetical protein
MAIRKWSLVALVLLTASWAAIGATLSICSFNIQFLGHFKDRDNVALAAILAGYDIVVIQELVAPPYPLSFQDGTPATADDEARAFFEEMNSNGFKYWLSEEDTGPGAENHKNTTGTEWWVAFYKPGAVARADDLPHGFLAEDRSANPAYDRVPYAFAFRSADQDVDFVLVSVHLAPGSSARRSAELGGIARWIDLEDRSEHDFIVLGDMNIQDCTELASITPDGFVSLNANCEATNTTATPKPYDHVLYQPEFSPEVQAELTIVDLVAAMRPFWTSDAPYPGDPYNHNAFRVVYSDHRPIVFTLWTDGPDDD